MLKINWMQRALSAGSLTDIEYEDYLEYNMMKVIEFDEALQKGKVRVNNINYFLSHPVWDLNEPEDYQLVSTFYIFGVVPKQFKQLLIDMNTKEMFLGKSFHIGDYDMQLSMTIKKELIPLLEAGIISYE